MDTASSSNEMDARNQFLTQQRANYVGFNEGNLSKIASYTSNPPNALSAPCNTLKTAYIGSKRRTASKAREKNKGSRKRFATVMPMTRIIMLDPPLSNFVLWWSSDFKPLILRTR